MRIKLERPICFIDLETTGLDTKQDRIIEISVVKLQPNGEKEVRTRRINPTIPISKGAYEVHGISNEELESEPTFKEIASQLLHHIEGCDLSGYNALHFDFPVLYNEFLRAEIEWDYKNSHLIDVNNIFKITNPRDLTAAYKYYCGKDHTGAHGAESDAVATMEIFIEQMKDEQLPEKVNDIAHFSNYDREILDLSGKFTHNAEGSIIFTFGPYRNEPAKEHIDFVQWMYGRDFNDDTKAICEGLLTGGGYGL